MTTLPGDRPVILLATGTTGGHVAPALALAETFRERVPDARLAFVGPPGGVAQEMVARAGYELEPLDVPPLAGGGPVRWLTSGLRMPATGVRTLRLLRRLRPDLVVGTGGATCGPLLAAAALAGTRTLTFEANVRPGLANVSLARLVDAVAVAWPGAAGRFGKRGFVTGCPVRREVLAVAAAAPPAGPGEPLRILILGGSGGSGALDSTMAAAAPHLAGLAQPPAIMHQAARDNVLRLRHAYRAAGLHARVEPFLPEIATEYVHCDLVVARAGGVTLAEIAAAGRPSIVVPLPAAGDHQRANAAAWARLGAGLAIAPEELCATLVADTVRALTSDPERRERMRQAALRFSAPDASARIVDRCLLLLGVTSGPQECVSPS